MHFCDVLVKDRRTFGCSGSPALIYAFLPYANRHPLNEWSAGVILPQIAFQPFLDRLLKTLKSVLIFMKFVNPALNVKIGNLETFSVSFCVRHSHRLEGR